MDGTKRATVNRRFSFPISPSLSNATTALHQLWPTTTGGAPTRSLVMTKASHKHNKKRTKTKEAVCASIFGYAPRHRCQFQMSPTHVLFAEAKENAQLGNKISFMATSTRSIDAGLIEDVSNTRQSEHGPSGDRLSRITSTTSLNFVNM